MSLYFSTAAWLVSCKRSMFMESVQCLEYGQLRLFVQRDLVLLYVLHKEWLSGKGLMFCGTMIRGNHTISIRKY